MKLGYRFLVCAALSLTALGGAAGCVADATTGDEQDATAKAAAGRFEIFVGQDGQHYFHLLAGNGEKVLQSEGYTSLAGAENGVEAIRSTAVDSKHFKLLQASNGEYYFNVVANNNEIVATSELYISKSNATRAITTVKSLVKLANRELAATTGGARFKLFKSTGDSKYYFNMTAGNGEIMLQSEGYTTKSAAQKGIASVRTNGSDDNNFEVFVAKNGQYFCTLYAGNNKVVAHGETYVSESNAKHAVDTLTELFRTDAVADAK